LKPADWPDNIRDARAIQAALRYKIRIVPLNRQPHLIAAVDAAFSGEQIACQRK
jgi:hypothetical protein